MAVLVPLHDFKPKLNRSISGFAKSIFLQRRMEVSGVFLSFTGLLMCLPCVIPTCLSLCHCRPAVMGLKTPCGEFVIWVGGFFSVLGDLTLLMQSYQQQAFPIISHLTHALAETHTCARTPCCVITDKYFPFTWRWSKITVLWSSTALLTLHLRVQMHTCERSHASSLPLLSLLQSDSSLFTFFIFTDSIYLSQLLPYLRSALHYPPSARPLLISPLLSLLILFILPSSCHILFLLFCIRLSGGIPVTPWFVIHSSFPVMTTSPALSFSWGISHDLIDD